MDLNIRLLVKGPSPVLRYYTSFMKYVNSCFQRESLREYKTLRLFGVNLSPYHIHQSRNLDSQDL